MAKSKKPKAEDPMIPNDWRAESDLATLMEAEKIKKDAKRMESVRALARKRLEDVAKVLADSKETTTKQKESA